MPWIKLCFDCQRNLAESLADQLSELGAESVCLQDSGDQAILEPAPGRTQLWDKTQVSALFSPQVDIASILVQLHASLGNLPAYHLESLQDQQWERVWLQFFQPMRFGRRLWICPSEYPPPHPEHINVFLDPGLAFGTGTHASTRLCLEWLEQNLPKDCRMIDYGCGSGILSVAAAKLGARHVWAVDHDPQALLASRENAARNQVATQISVMDPTLLGGTVADLIIANILLEPLIRLAPEFCILLNKGGRLVMSGIMEDQVSTLMQAFGPKVDFQSARILDGWACVWGQFVG